MGPVRGPTGKSTRRALIALRRGDKQKRGRGSRVEVSEPLADALTARMINRAFGTTYKPSEIAELEDATIDEMVTAAQMLEKPTDGDTDGS